VLLDDRAKEACLPVLILPGLPRGDELRAVEDIAVEDLRDARSEGEALRGVVVVGELAAEVSERMGFEVRGKEGGDAPSEGLGLERIGGRAGASETIEPCSGGVEVRGREDGEARGELEREAGGEGLRGDEDGFLGEGGRQRADDELG
jgi:hypothetical protein